MSLAVLHRESRPIPRRELSRQKEGSVILLGAVMASTPPRKEEGGIPTIPCQAIPRTEHLHSTRAVPVGFILASGLQ